MENILDTWEMYTAWIKVIFPYYHKFGNYLVHQRLFDALCIALLMQDLPSVSSVYPWLQKQW